MSASRRLALALEASARAAGCAVRVRSEGERPWSSPTYVGTRHDMTATGEPSAALSAWLAGLGDTLLVPGHVVAELTASPHGHVAALMLEA